jgi:hypothetical protein
MLILFDQGTPVAIRHSLEGHTVRTVREQGWSDLLNGELLRVAEEAGFEVLLTTDKNMVYQHSLKGRKIALVGVRQRQMAAHRADGAAGRSRGERHQTGKPHCGRYPWQIGRPAAV